MTVEMEICFEGAVQIQNLDIRVGEEAALYVLSFLFIGSGQQADFLFSWVCLSNEQLNS